MTTRAIQFYFDFISPYSFLASALIARSPELRRLPLIYRPVSFGTMLSRRGVQGPGEIPARRRRGLEDLLCLSAYYGFDIQGPPTHPFNSVYALRSVLDVNDEANRARLTGRYFRCAWIEGQDLEDLGVLRACLQDVGIDQDPEAAATKPENRKALKANTLEALDLGAHGVPTFAVDDLLFFGHDRLDLLAAYIEGKFELDRAKVKELLARPQPGGMRGSSI
ncbi:MAG: DsbA family protein [Deltaproteobacteria bacterium]|nr:DsbA family protein [Deltaproteobacteria bacterium]